MVRVPRLPLSMVAVASNTPSSISATDIGVRTASLELFSFFAPSRATRRVSGQLTGPDGHREPAWKLPEERKSEYAYGHRSKRPTCPRSGEPGSHYRRPPDTD